MCSLRTGALPVEGGVGTDADDGVGTSSPDPLPTSWCVKKYQVASLCYEHQSFTLEDR